MEGHSDIVSTIIQPGISVGLESVRSDDRLAHCGPSENPRAI